MKKQCVNNFILSGNLTIQRKIIRPAIIVCKRLLSIDEIIELTDVPIGISVSVPKGTYAYAMSSLRNFLFILFLLYSQASYGLTLKPELYLISNNITGLLINNDFEKAMKITDSLIIEDSEEPLFPFLHLCVLRARDLDFDRIIDPDAYFETYNRTIGKISEYEASKGIDSYSQTLAGYAYVTYASYYIQNNQPFNAIGRGMEALKMFRDVKKKDSTNYDVDFLLGFYNYTKAELRKKFWFVLFWFPGSKKRGLESIERCSEKGTFTRLVAKMSLIDIYNINSETEKSEKLSDSLFVCYPKSRYILWSKVRYFEKEKEYKKCAEAYETLSNSYQKAKYGDYNMLNTRLKQIELLKKTKQNSKISAIVEKFGSCKECFMNERNKKICRDIKRYSEK